MDEVAQGATYSDTVGPVKDASGTIVADDEANVTVTIYDSADADQSSGATVAYVGAGLYRITKAIGAAAALGWWPVVAVWDDGSNPAQTFTGGVTVVTATQADPAGDLTAAIALLSGKLGAASVVQVPLTNAGGAAVWTKGSD